MPITRGFVGSRRPERPGRIPPGQYDTGSSWPTLTAEATPSTPLEQWAEQWRMRVDGLVVEPQSWSWQEIHARPGSAYCGHIHGVTPWSKFDMTFRGGRAYTRVEAARPRPEARFVLAHSTTGYTTNLPLEDVTGGRAWVVWEVDGKPLPRGHGGPIRLIVPHLYFWKSAKWITRIELLDHDRPGFWEQNGYHDRGDPWLEQRYQGDP